MTFVLKVNRLKFQFSANPTHQTERSGNNGQWDQLTFSTHVQAGLSCPKFKVSKNKLPENTKKTELCDIKL